jgi:hypothetical protein
MSWVKPKVASFTKKMGAHGAATCLNCALVLVKFVIKGFTECKILCPFPCYTIKVTSKVRWLEGKNGQFRYTFPCYTIKVTSKPGD